MRVVVAEDSLLFREGLIRLLEDAGITVVAQAEDADGLLAAVDVHRPDLAIVDVRMPPTHTDEGLRAATELRPHHPSLGVLVLTHHVESYQAMRLLADSPTGVGYLLKDRVTDLTEFIEAVRRVGSGGSVIDPEVVSVLLARRRHRDRLAELTTRERQVLGLMAEGRSNQAICDALFISQKTVESHVASIMTKLGLLPTPDDHRRVLAVLTYLREAAAEETPATEPNTET
jgi:DNA-binding NarL/FixJ family response regulator